MINPEDKIICVYIKCNNWTEDNIRWFKNNLSDGLLDSNTSTGDDAKVLMVKELEMCNKCRKLNSFKQHD